MANNITGDEDASCACCQCFTPNVSNADASWPTTSALCIMQIDSGRYLSLVISITTNSMLEHKIHVHNTMTIISYMYYIIEYVRSKTTATN